jgi:hypothetical protein
MGWRCNLPEPGFSLRLKSLWIRNGIFVEGIWVNPYFESEHFRLEIQRLLALGYPGMRTACVLSPSFFFFFRVVQTKFSCLPPHCVSVWWRFAATRNTPSKNGQDKHREKCF